jgi:hypothetical protein
MTDDTRFKDTYLRLNELTQDVATLKIQAGTVGTFQLAIARTMTLATSLISDMREAKFDIRQIKAYPKNLNVSVEKILRLLRYVIAEVIPKPRPRTICTRSWCLFLVTAKRLSTPSSRLNKTKTVLAELAPLTKRLTQRLKYTDKRFNYLLKEWRVIAWHLLFPMQA